MRPGGDHPRRPPDDTPDRRRAAGPAPAAGGATVARRRPRPDRHSGPRRRRRPRRPRHGHAARKRWAFRAGHCLSLAGGPDHRAGKPRGGVPRVLHRCRRGTRRRSHMNLVLLLRTWRAQLGKVVLIAAVSTAWGWLMPFFYSQFSGMLRELAKQNPLFGQLSNFGSGSILTLPGTITLGMQHPFAIALISVFGVGVAALAIAGERQSGTLEVLLARPIPRGSLLITIWVALLVLVAAVVAALVGGMVIGAITQDLLGELALDQMPLV